MTIGKEGESTFAKMLKEQGVNVTDVSGNCNYWHKDIDFIIDNGKEERTVEVKNDTRIYKTGNMYIETANPRSQGGKGWFLFCQADYLAYGDAINHRFYFIRLKDLREYVAEHYMFLREASTYDGSRGFLIALEDVKDLIFYTLE
jgi:hypothetical protein